MVGSRGPPGVGSAVAVVSEAMLIVSAASVYSRTNDNGFAGVSFV